MPVKTPDFQHLFNSLSNGYIVFDVDDPKFTIIAQNDEHVRLSLVKKGEAVGKPVLEAYPDTSEKYLKSGVSDLVESFRKVIHTGMSDTMPLLKYDLQDRDGNWEQKYWQVTHHPIFGTGKKVVAVYQATEDITDKHLAGEKLQEFEEKFNLAATNGLISVWNWDIAKKKVYADKNLSKLFGIDAVEGADGLPLERFMKSIHPDDQGRVQQDISTALTTKRPYESEYRTVSGKEVRYVIARGIVNADDKGVPIGFTGIVIDITDRKRAEMNVAESENRLRFMADSMPQLVWITRPDGFHEYYNQRWYDYTGTLPGTTDGEGWNNLFHPDDQPAAWKRWRHSLGSGEPYEIEYRLYHAKSNSYRWVIGRAMPYRDSSGTIIKWYGTCTDVNDLKVAEENLRFLSEASAVLASSLDYKKTLRQISRLLVPRLADWATVDIVDEQGHLQQVALAHKDPKKVKWAKELRAAQGPPDMSAPTGLPNVLRTGQPEMYPEITDEMLQASAKNKEELALMRSIGFSSAIIVPIKVDGTTIGAITLISAEQKRHYGDPDLRVATELASRASVAIKNSSLYERAQHELAERNKFERELRRANDELESRVKERTSQLEKLNLNLERSNRELEDFAYVASHDLQEPLRKIQAFGDLLGDEYAESLGEGSDYLKRMQAAAGRMSTLINDLLTFSRVTTKQAPFTKVRLGVVVDEVLSDLETRIQTTGGKVTVSELPVLSADATQMRQLMQNLIANALKFHKDDTAPRISITARERIDKHTGETLDEIRVKDNGVGFEEKYLDRIFSVFQRLHGRDAFEGTGIGLAVCRKIVERHGGTITAKSKLGRGATFIVTLPRNRKKGVEAK